jgi:hypothetical protein
VESLGQRPVVALAVPIYDGQRFVGLLKGRVDLRTHVVEPLQQAARIGRTAHAGLIDRQGAICPLRWICPSFTGSARHVLPASGPRRSHGWRRCRSRRICPVRLRRAPRSGVRLCGRPRGVWRWAGTRMRLCRRVRELWSGMLCSGWANAAVAWCNSDRHAAARAGPQLTEGQRIARETWTRLSRCQERRDWRALRAH